MVGLGAQVDHANAFYSQALEEDTALRTRMHETHGQLVNKLTDCFDSGKITVSQYVNLVEGQQRGLENRLNAIPKLTPPPASTPAFFLNLGEINKDNNTVEVKAGLNIPGLTFASSGKAK